MNNKVSVVKCDRYSEVQNAVENAVSLIGGIEKFVKKGDNVVTKGQTYLSDGEEVTIANTAAKTKEKTKTTEKGE